MRLLMIAIALAAACAGGEDPPGDPGGSGGEAGTGGQGGDLAAGGIGGVEESGDCLGILACERTCGGAECHELCRNGASRAALSLRDELTACNEDEGCDDLVCTQAICLNEYLDCVGRDALLTCPSLNDCENRCRGLQPDCVERCRASATARAPYLLLSLKSCAAVFGCTDTPCLRDRCPVEYRQCVNDQG